jgi:hypothetical protein
LESAVKHLPLEVPITVIEDPSEEVDLEKLVKEFPRVQYLKNESTTRNRWKLHEFNNEIYRSIYSNLWVR